MNILNNELVRKYFLKCTWHKVHEHPCYWDLAFNVLQAMQEPIKNGERYLNVEPCGDIYERIADESLAKGTGLNYHFWWLRLPDSFQPRWKKCKCMCHTRPDKADGLPHPEREKPFPAPENPKEPPYRSPQPCNCPKCKPADAGEKCCLHGATCPKPSPANPVEEKIKQLERWHKEEMSSSYHLELVEILRALCKREFGEKP